MNEERDALLASCSEEACAEVEVAHHPIDYKRAAEARARAERLVSQYISDFDDDIPPDTTPVAVWEVAGIMLREIAAALRFERYHDSAEAAGDAVEHRRDLAGG